MSKYRHVGTYTMVYDTPKDGQSLVLNTFGQLVELPDEVGESIHSLIPEEDFQSLGIDPDHLVKFATVASHAKAPADFIQKRDAAWGMMADKKTGVGKVEPNGSV